MPAFKLTKTLYNPRKLQSKWESLLKENSSGMSCYRLLSAENAQEQIACLKEVQKEIDGRLNISSDRDEHVTHTLKFLEHLFFISTTKNPIRRILNSYLQNLPDYVKSDIVRPEIESELRSMCDDRPPFDSLDDIDVTTLMHVNEEHRHNVDTLSALIGNFILGEECVATVSMEILGYLGKLQEQFYRTFRPQLSPVQKNETMHHCMETVKLANRICQRSAVTIETRLKQPELMVWYQDIVKKLVQSDLDILMNDEFLLDCKTTSAMNICLMLKFTDVGDQLLNILDGTVFSHHSNLSVLSPSACQPNWLTDLGLDRLSKVSLTDSSFLCLCYGVLSMVAIETLLNISNERCFMLDILLPEFLDLSKKVSDVGSKLLAAKSLHLLTQRIRSYITKVDLDTVDVELSKRLKGDSENMKLILDFIWTSWEDSVEAVRFTVKDIFENLVNIHTIVSRSIQQDPFLDSLTISILNDVSWSCKGKYGTLSVLVRHLGSARMLELHPAIALQVLQQLEEQTLSCYVRDLYDELCTSHLKELKARNQLQILEEENGNQYADWSHWFTCWVEPVINMLCQSTLMQKKHLIEYVLPKLLKTSDRTLYHMIHTLSERLHDKSGNLSQQRHKGDQLGALIMCVRRARAMGLLRNQSEIQSDGDQPLKENLFGVVDVDLLKYALVINNEQIRLDAFALLCESQKTTELISCTEVRLVQTFIPLNMTNQNPAFRQLLLSYLKKFLCRMRESMQVLRRQISKIPTAKDNITRYQTFLRWLIRHMFDSLYPGSTFPRRTTALNGLSLLIDSLQGSQEESLFYKELETTDLQSLFHCLTDTFEDNKGTASRILMACFQQNFKSLLLTSAETSSYLDLGLTLGVSSRPQDGLTGAYLLRVLIYQPVLWDILKETACSQYSNTCKGRELVTEPDCTELLPFKVLMNSVDGSEGERKFLLLWILLKSLEDQLGVACENLLVAAANKPMYPTMLCIRYLMCDIQFRHIKIQNRPCWSDFLSRFISLCLKISEIVSPVVHNCSPEGNIPMEAITDASHENDVTDSDQNQSKQASSDMFQSEQKTTDITQSEQTVMLMPEYLTVCCWRSVKEISLILGQLTSDLPPLDSGAPTSDLRGDVNSGFLSYSQILSIGEYFTTQLLDSKHRGAFELAYTGFVKVTEMLWRSNIPEFYGLPKTWLKEVMEDIVSDNPNSRLCATRRSAGVPFYVQAIVSTEPSSTGRVSFKDTMVKLIDLAYSQPSKDNCNPKVHALNILRMLYKDSRLKDNVTPYLADGLKVAILGFKSHLWAVRNAATLLMAAMMNRVFGVKRSKDESSLSRKNCQTGKTFFFKYPTLYQFLLDELSEATENIGTQLHPGLYPILMVLGRLFPSTMEGTDTTLNLAAFIPFVVRCCSSPVLKTRMMAARALQPLVEKDHMITVFSDLLTLLPSSQEDGIGQNQVHGVLLQVKFLLNTTSMLPAPIIGSLQKLMCMSWLEKMDFLTSRSNPCLLTRKCALEISSDLLEKFDGDSSILCKLLRVLNTEVSDVPDSMIYSSSAPCLTEFMCTVCDLYIQCMCTYRIEDFGIGSQSTETGSVGNQFDFHDTVEDFCLKFLRSTSYEVRRSFFTKVTEVCLHGNTGKVSESINCVPEVLDLKLDLDSQRCFTKKFKEELAANGKVYMSLLELCLSETHTECQVELFRLLQVYPEICAITQNNPDNMYRQLIQVISEWLDRMENTTLSEEVMASCIEYLGTSLSIICQETRMGGVKTADATPLLLLERFIDILRTICSAVETAVSVQLACTNALVALCRSDILLAGLRGGVMKVGGSEIDNGHVGGSEGGVDDTYGGGIKMVDASEGGIRTGVDLVGGVEGKPQVTDKCEGGVKVKDENKGGIIDKDVLKGGVKVSVGCIESFYCAVFDLLQTDDIDVKDKVSDVLLAISDDWIRGSPQSYICTSLLINHWLRTSPDVWLVASSLLKLMIENQEPEQKEDERLFDRGEMNTYRDQIDFIQTIDGILMKVLMGEEISDLSWKNIDECRKVDKMTISQGTKPSCDATLCDKLLPVILSYIQTILSQCSGPDVFLDWSKHEAQVMKVYTNLLFIKYGFVLAMGTEQLKTVLETWTDFKNSLDMSGLPILVKNVATELLNFEKGV